VDLVPNNISSGLTIGLGLGRILACFVLRRELIGGALVRRRQVEHVPAPVCVVFARLAISYGEIFFGSLF
jgi:hypothetical protein